MSGLEPGARHGAFVVVRALAWVHGQAWLIVADVGGLYRLEWSYASLMRSMRGRIFASDGDGTPLGASVAYGSDIDLILATYRPNSDLAERACAFWRATGKARNNWALSALIDHLIPAIAANSRPA